jgi:hypothetical protein
MHQAQPPLLVPWPHHQLLLLRLLLCPAQLLPVLPQHHQLLAEPPLLLALVLLLLLPQVELPLPQLLPLARPVLLLQQQQGPRQPH